MQNNIKPFSLDQAKAGAPVGLLDQNENGYKLEILKYGDKKIFGVLADWNGCESAEFWQLDGTYGHRAEPNGPLTLVMLPLGYCEGKPVFVGDELQWINGGKMVKAYAHMEHDWEWEGFKWPKPEPKYPETRIDKEKWHEIWATYKGDAYESCVHVANESIKKAIQDGDVFTKQQVTAVLEQLRGICDQYVNPHNIRSVMDQTDWDEVLKGAM